MQSHELPAYLTLIAQRKQHREARCVLGQTPVAHLGMTELLLDHAKRVH